MALIAARGRETILNWARKSVDELRAELLCNGAEAEREMLIERLAVGLQTRDAQQDRFRIDKVINATGVVLHTGLGRAPLSAAATAALSDVAAATNLEVDLATGERRYRGYQLQETWQRLTGAEDALIVNNNAAATLLTLQAICGGREVIISRGQLIEIGGSFRLPEIFELSGAVLREVGTTNRTKLSDYEAAIGPETAAIMHVHPSNYRVMGFAETPAIDGLAELAHRNGLIAIDDIGSGALVEMTRYGLPSEPTFHESLDAGADLVLGSGDKLLGGPQCGIILGRREFVANVRQHPLARTMRIDKLALGALSATLDSYLRSMADEEIPTLSLLATGIDELRRRAGEIRNSLQCVAGLTLEVADDVAPVGGGSLPLAELPTAVLRITHAVLSAEKLAERLRLGTPRLFGRIQQGQLLLDLRSVLPGDDALLVEAFQNASLA